MITITFKNVGQGDSIILEWYSNENKRIGIIDCKTNNFENPVLNYIIKEQYQSISFLLLSHPHSDHFSGFSQLIDYCINNSIKIDHFLHTCNNMPSFWKAAVNNKVTESELLNLYTIIRTAKDKIGLKHSSIQGDSIYNDISLGESIKMKILAPTSQELDNYARRYIDPPFEEEIGNSPSANWLSTFIKIYCGEWYILLTSDIEKSVLKYLGIMRKEEFGGTLILAQSPHHGASKNHYNSFWRHLEKSELTPIVFSVGKNHYNHPSTEAVNFFKNNKFDVFATNEIGGLSNIKIVGFENISDKLDVFSAQISAKIDDKLNGDKVFKINLMGEIV